MSASIPSIPPRPNRSQREQHTMAAPKDIPSIPPRPARLSNRAPSPTQDSFAPSPLSQTSFAINQGSSQGGGLYSNSRNASSSSLPKRPSSVNLPSIGQEGSEYESFYEGQEEASEDSQGAGVSPHETRNIGNDVKLHAPKPALPTSSAKARIATVTRTDSKQAAAAGIGKAHSDDSDSQTRSLKAKASFASQDSHASTERPMSVHAGDDEHGIPEIGQRVPMYPNAGDVQAPSPSPYAQTFPAGIGFHNDGRHHGRQRSGKEHLPPGSYGLHGHGTPAQDRFEKAWYEKHPDALEREEHGEYGPGIGGGRGEWALSSDDLNKIVRDTASRGAGFGTSPAMASTPNEQIGYIASEEYASRLAAPRSPSAGVHHRAHSNNSQSHIESPLRQANIPADTDGPSESQKGSQRGSQKGSSDDASKAGATENAVESEAEEDVIHIEAPPRPFSKISGGGYDPPTEDLGPQGGNTEEEGGWLDERGYGTPILASDEVAKEPGAEFLQPAVEPHQERRGNEYYAGVDSEHPASYMTGHVRNGSRGSSIAGSRPTSRAGGAAAGLSGLSRFTSRDDRDEVGTPLEDVEEYEPLFPEDEKEGATKTAKERPMTAAERLKRHDMLKHKFPSKDIWEDAPSSAQLHATVSTPDLPATAEGNSKEAPPAEPTHVDEAFRQQDGSRDPDGPSFLEEESKSHLAAHLRDEVPSRPGKQRFPSRDIWEDTPASLQLQTTVATPQGNELQSPPTVPRRPTTGAVTSAQDKAASGRRVDETEARATTGSAAALPKPEGKPSVPARPSKVSGGSSPKPSPTDRKGPSLPERPKPQVPARPAKLVGRDSSENIPLTKTTSASSAKSIDSGRSVEDAATATAPRSKPAVPLRPSGGKIASLKAGFMSDLDKRLQKGPQGPKPKERSLDDADREEEKEAVPLSDARKGRARGPARRKPAASPSAAAETSTPTDASQKLGLVGPNLVWQIADDGAVRVPSSSPSKKDAGSGSSTKAEQAPTPTLATNTAGEPVLGHDEVASPVQKTPSAPTQPSVTDDPEGAVVEVASAAGKASSKPTLAEPESQENGAEAKEAAASGHTSSEPAIAPKHAAGGTGEDIKDLQ